MARRVIDLSQPLSRESQLHPFFPPTQILRHIQHTDAAPGRPVVQRRDHHHLEPRRDARRRLRPLPAGRRRDRRDAARHVLRRRDLRRHPRVPGRPRRDARPRSKRAVEASGQELREGDILLFCSDHYNRTAGTPAFLDGFNGISAEAVHWMADRGVKIFGVETISPDLVYLTDEYPTHKACAERGLTHYENLNNLKEVVGPPLPVLRLPASARARVRLAGAGGCASSTNDTARLLARSSSSTRRLARTSSTASGCRPGLRDQAAGASVKRAGPRRTGTARASTRQGAERLERVALELGLLARLARRACRSTARGGRRTGAARSRASARRPTPPTRPGAARSPPPARRRRRRRAPAPRPRG